MQITTSSKKIIIDYSLYISISLRQVAVSQILTLIDIIKTFMATTINQQIADLSRLRKNTEAFLLGFLNFTTSQKPPFPNSWFGFDFDKNTYVFMILKNHSQYVSGNKMIYYPDGTNRILITPETKWLYKIYDDVNYNNAITDKQEYLQKVASVVQPILKGMLDQELADIKALNSKTVDNEQKMVKNLF